jgi:hypothetical protein
MEEITVEKIKERIRDNLERAREQNFSSNELIKKLELVNVPNETIKGKIIVFGLKYKHLIEKIPILNTAAKKFYPFLVKTPFQDQSFTNHGIKGIIRGVPLIGYLIWWIYIIIKRLNEWIQNIPQPIQVGEILKPIRQQTDSFSIMLNSTIKSGNDIIPEILFLDNLNAYFHPTLYKNWDLGLFMRFILNHFGKAAWILDIGCVSNPLLFNLAGRG